SLLEVFQGQATWRLGTVAPYALDAYLAEPPDEPGLPALPPGLADVLRRCLRPDPAERWPSLAEVAEALRSIYRRDVGHDCPRPQPTALDGNGRASVIHDRRTTTGTQWPDPRDWLREAFEADGRDPAGIAPLLPGRAGSRKAQAIADLAAFEE